LRRAVKDIKPGAELTQVIERICPLKNQQRQDYDSADIGYQQDKLMQQKRQPMQKPRKIITNTVISPI
jgi:hypothetical protein